MRPLHFNGTSRFISSILDLQGGETLRIAEFFKETSSLAGDLGDFLKVMLGHLDAGLLLYLAIGALHPLTTFFGRVLLDSYLGQLGWRPVDIGQREPTLELGRNELGLGGVHSLRQIGLRSLESHLLILWHELYVFWLHQRHAR